MRFDQSKRIFASRQTCIFIAALFLMLLVNQSTAITTNAQTLFNLQREQFNQNQRFQKILKQVNGNRKAAFALFQREEIENDKRSPKILLQQNSTDSKDYAKNVVADGGALDATFAPKISTVGNVSKITALPSDKAFISGDFVRVNNVERKYIARLNADGSVDLTFNFTATQVNNNSVQSIDNFAVQPDGKIVVICNANFSSPRPLNEPISRNSQLFRINSDGSLDNTFAGGGFSGFPFVTSIGFDPTGRIVVSGFFSDYNGFRRNGLVRINTNGSVDTTINPTLNADGNGSIFASSVQTDGKIIIGGSFTSYNGANASGIARLNVDGTLDTTFNAGGTGLGSSSNIKSVTQIALTGDGKIYIQGSFNSYNGATRTNNIARLNADGTLDSAFGNAPQNAPEFNFILISGTGIVPLANGKVLFGNVFTITNSSSFVRFNADGTVDSTFNPDFQDGAYAVRSDGRILIGSFGGFIRNGVTHGGLVQLEANGVFNNSFSVLLQSGFAPSFEKTVVQPDGKILIGTSGFFGSGSYIVDGVFKGGLLRLNADGTSDNSFNIALPNGDNSLVSTAFALQPDGKIIVNTADSVFPSGFSNASTLRLNADGTADASFNVINDFARQIVLQPDGKFLVASFDRITRYNSNGSVDLGFTRIVPTTSSTFFSLINFALQPTGKIIVTFDNISMNNEFIPRIARYNTNGSVDNSFGTITFNPSNNNNLSAVVGDFAIQPDGKIVIVGQFAGISSSNGTPSTRQSNNIVRLNSDGTIDTTLTSSSLSTTFLDNVLVQPDNKIVASQGATVVRFNADGSNDSTFFAGRGVDGFINNLALQPDGQVLVAGSFSTFNRQTRFGLARLRADAQAQRQSAFDFDGDGLADISIFRDGVWHILQSREGYKIVQFGIATDKLVPADYDGDGRTDIAVFRDGVWYILQSSRGVFRALQFGLSNDVLVPADYDGDGRADIAVFRDGVWYISQSSDEAFRIVRFGLSNDKPVPADYDGDGRADIAVTRANSNSLTWYIQQTPESFRATNFGISTDKPVPADYDGDGRADIAVFRDNTWFAQRSTGGFTNFQFGQTGDVPVAADYDGDGRADFAVTRGVNNQMIWYVLQSNNNFRAVSFGLNTDKPLPNSYIR